jgi:hypothetical protein
MGALVVTTGPAAPAEELARPAHLPSPEPAVLGIVGRPLRNVKAFARRLALFRCRIAPRSSACCRLLQAAATSGTVTVRGAGNSAEKGNNTPDQRRSRPHL